MYVEGIPEEEDFSKKQFESFLFGVQKLVQLTDSYFLKHILNSEKNNKNFRGGYPNLETMFYCLAQEWLSIDNNIRNTINYIINFDTIFPYYDYQELKLARSNAQTAFWFSVWAVSLSLITLFSSIYYSQIQTSYSEKQLTTPISLSWSQLEELKSSSNKIIDQINETNNKIDDTNQYLDDIDVKINKLNSN